ncbi:MAG: hypothetical protein ABIH36_03620 [bacterium]
MAGKSRIERLYQSGRSVFTIDDLRVLWQEDSPDNLKSQAAYYVAKGKLQRPRRGVYTLNPYNELELANKLIVPSYLSLETALLKHGIIFQPEPYITSVASYNKKITVGERTFRFYEMPTDILSDTQGLQRVGEILIAGPERAICDWLYLGRTDVFANLDGIDKHKIKQVASIYLSDQVKNLVDNLIKRVT